MSDYDRERWDEKYAALAVPSLQPLDPWLERILHGRTPGRALDVACGTGSLSVQLALRGWTVTGIDISPVGLQHARQLADQHEVGVDWVCDDLESYRPEVNRFDLILIFRYLQRGDLGQRLVRALKPGGLLVHSTFVDGPLPEKVQSGRPKNPDFLLRPGELPQLYTGLRTLDYRENAGGDAGLAKFAGIRETPR